MTNRIESVMSAADELVGEAANEFFAAIDRGEAPSISEFSDRYPDIAEHIRRTFPALLLVGNCSTGRQDRAFHPAGDEIKTLGDFRLIREIGRGGMGVVYEAEQLSLRRRVALKVLPFAAVLDKQQLARFQSEAYAAATLHHAHIVPVHAVGCDRGVHFYAMQYISGRSLAEVIEQLRRNGERAAGTRKVREPRGKRGQADFAPTTPQNEPVAGETSPIAALSTIHPSDSGEYFRRVAELGIQAASALEYSHANGIVHRDVKPGNLLIDDGCKLWVTDFGLARVGGDAGLTMTGDLVGTVRYMSPEQVLGRRSEIDHRTDIYSLGATLYEMLSLRSAYHGDERAELLRRIAMEEPPHLRHINRRIPVDLETIISKAMEKRPADRYTSALHLAEDLRRYLAREPITAKPVSRAEKIFKWTRRHHSLVSIAGVCFLLLSVLLGASVVLINRARNDVLAALEETSALLYVSEMRDAFTAWEKGWPDEVRKFLDRQRPVDEAPDRRGFEWYLLDTLSRQPKSTALAGHVGPVNELAVFPDRRRLASVGSDGTLRLWDLNEGSSQTIVLTKEVSPRSEMELHSVAISPDGRYIAAGGENLHLIDTRDGLAARQIFHGAATVESLAFHSDGTKLAAGIRYEEVCLLTLDGTVLQRVPCSSRVDSLDFVAGHPWLLIPNYRPQEGDSPAGIIQLWRGDLSRIEREFETRASSIAKPSPCGRYFVAGESYRSLSWIYDLASGEHIDRTSSARDRLMSLAYSPGGDAIAVGYLNGIVECFDLEHKGEAVSAVGRRTVIDAHQGAVTNLQFVSRDQLASSGSDGQVKLWDVSRGYRRRQHIDTPNLSDIEWSPDGTLLACLGENALHFIDEDGLTISHREFEERPSDMAWSRSGEYVVLCFEDSDRIVLVDRSGIEILTAAHEGDKRAVAIAPNGHVVAATSHKQLQLFSTEGPGELQAEFPLENARAVSFSHKGDRLAYGGGSGTIIVKDIGGNRDRLKFPCGSSTIELLLFSPDDSLLASGHSDGMIRIWDLKRGALRSELAGHERKATKLAFSPDGRSLLSVSRDDGTLRVWSVMHHRGYGMVRQFSKAETIVNRADSIRHFSLSADGRKLAVACQDMNGNFEVLVWKLDLPGMD
jgi:serine/threonine protein kinase/WD40 repeat protein